MAAELSKQEIADIDKEVSREAQRINQELEIERILRSFRLNPFDVLDIDYGVDEKSIKAIYRKKSLRKSVYLAAAIHLILLSSHPP